MTRARSGVCVLVDRLCRLVARLLVLLTLLFCLPSSLTVAEQPPNIVMILVDDMGYGDLTLQRMPKCSELARRGTTLKLYSHQNCTPTRAALLSGVYPHRLGLHDVWPTPVEPGLPADTKLVPEYLAAGGYRCGMFGKWHLGWKERNDWPTRRGFAEFIGCLGGHINSYGTQQLGTPYADRSIGHDHHNIHDLQWNEVPLYTATYSTELFTRGAIKFIERAKNADSPFFLYAPFNAPHAPYSAPRRYVEQLLATGEFDPTLLDMLYEINGVMTVDSKDAVAVYETSPLLYAAMLLAIDDGVHSIYTKLEELQLADNTLFVFASDNGVSYVRDPYVPEFAVKPVGSSGDFKGFKGLPYEGGIRVANFVVWPERIQPEQLISTNVWIGDLAATFMQVAGMEVPRSFDGGSILPAIDRNEDVVRRLGGRRLLPYIKVKRVTLTDRPDAAFVARVGLIAGNRKYIRTTYYDSERQVLPDPIEELFDLRHVPLEEENLIERPEYATWLSISRADVERFGGDEMFINLPEIPVTDVWDGFVRTLDFGFSDNGRVLESALP